jgi:RNA polymerase sigma-70 factor (ECF subfamily)
LTDDEWRKLLTAQARENSGLYFKLAYGVLRNPASAEDACQQALAAAWHARREIANSQALTAWLCRSVVNASFGERRRNQLERRAARRLAQGSAQHVDRDESYERRESLLAALAEVPEPARTVVVLRVMEERAGGEVAKIMCCSTAEVSRRLHRGLEHLRRSLQRRHVSVAELP